jgi:hypothetical protein
MPPEDSWLDDVTGLAALAGIALDAEQRSWLTQLDGKSVVPYRSDTALEAAVLGWLFLGPDPVRIIFAASGPARLSAFRSLANAISGTPELESRLQRIRYASGAEEIRTRYGSCIRFVAGEGRGYSADKLILGPGVSEQAGEALLPVIAGKPGWQLIRYVP